MDFYLLRGGQAVFVHAMVEDALRIGRAPDNDLVLNDALVSQHHALIWREDTGVKIRDLGSRNGTWVDERRVDEDVVVPTGATVRLGTDTVLHMRPPIIDLLPRQASFLVEDAATGRCVHVRSERFHFGVAPEQRLDAPEQAPRLATLLVDADGRVWLGIDDDDHQIEADQPFEVGGSEYVLRRDDALRATTAVPPEDRYPYVLQVTLGGPKGPQAVMIDKVHKRTHAVTTGNRSVLLYVLARQHARDRDASLPSSVRGWCSNHEVLMGVWGRTQKAENQVHVLVYRLRAELREAGFDPWCIEKREGMVRARVLEVEITAGTHSD